MSQFSDIEDIVAAIRSVRLGSRGSSTRPYKLLLLLAICRLYKKDLSRSKFVPIDDTLCHEFSEAAYECCSQHVARAALIEYPFYHLTSDGIWKLRLLRGKEDLFAHYRDSDSKRFTRRRLEETVEAGYLTDELDSRLRSERVCSRVEEFLIQELKRIASPQNVVANDASQSSSLFAHEQSALNGITGRVASHQLGEVLTNLEIHDPQSNRYFEIDLVIISSWGVYVTELKHWSGRIEIRPNSWLQNGSFYKQDPHKANNFKAKLLRGLYEKQFPSFPSIYFESVVVLTNPDVEAHGQSIPTTSKNNPTFDSIDGYLQYLKHCRKSGRAALERSQCIAFANYLQKLHSAGPPRDFVFPGYEVVERLYQYVDRAEVIARRTDIRHRRLCRLRIFYPPTSASTAQQREAHERATNTLNAVAKIGDHPNVLKVWDIPNENNFVVEGSGWSETGTLRDVLEREGSLSLNRAVEIAGGLLRGLQAAHDQYVVHRCVCPENVLMVDDTPKLMNFDLSYQLEDDRVTVIPDASQLKRTPYIAPEIYAGGVTPEAMTDLFSVGVVLFEMVTGKPPFSCSTDLERYQGQLTNDHRQQLQDQQVPEQTIDLLFHLIQQKPGHRPGNAEEVLEWLFGESEPSIGPHEANRRLESGEVSGLFEIEAFIRCGAESQLYKARGLAGRKILLKLFDRDAPRPRVVNEHRCSGAIHHQNIVRVDSYGQWQDSRYFIAFEWIEGTTLRDLIDSGEKPTAEQFNSVAAQLLDALHELHSHVEDGTQQPILHNDVKPDNILLVKGDRPVLVDFGAASEPCVGIYEGTEGYVAPDLRLGDERQYCQDGDLYALAVTLREWMLAGTSVVDAANETTPPDALLAWLQRGASPAAFDRYISAEEMKQSLSATTDQTQVAEESEVAFDHELDEPAETSFTTESEATSQLDVPYETTADPNPFVPYLNSMHSCNAETDNALAEYQSVNPFFAHIHVPHPIVERIEATLLGETRQHVILTGHAGDGKSTIAVELFKRLRGWPSDQPLATPLEPREDINSGAQSITLVKDFSEWSSRDRAALLEEMLDPQGRRFFLISNTGTLLEAFKACEMTGEGERDWTSVENMLLSRMEQSSPTSFPFRDTEFELINIAMMDNLPIAEQIFRRMLAPERWQVCHSAPCKAYCPIFRNVSLIRDNEETVIERLSLAYRRIYEYGTRLTLRQLCAHLAYMITSGLTYEDVVQMSQRANPPRFSEFAFYNRFFGDNGKEAHAAAQQLRAVRVVQEESFGSQPCATWERKLWLQTRDQEFGLRATSAPDDFAELRRIGANVSDDLLTPIQAREQVRRAVFFLHDFEKDPDGNRYITAFLKSAMLLNFVGWQTQDDESLSLQERNSLRLRILHVLQEHFTGVRLPEDMGADRHLYITLSRHSREIRQSAQVVLARYPEETFQVRLRAREGISSMRRRYLVLIGEIRGIERELALSLPFLDYVMMRNEGEMGQSLQASYVDRLERFKGQLIRSSESNGDEELMLVRLRTNHTFRRQMFAVRDNRLEVSDG